MLDEKSVHLIENLYLEDVSRDGVREGLFIGLPPQDHRRDWLLDPAHPRGLRAPRASLFNDVRS